MAGTRPRGISRSIIPDDVKENVAKIGISIVAVGAPAAGAQIHFNVSGAWGLGSDLQDCPAKIRAAFEVGKTGVKNTHAFSGNGF